MGLFLRKRIKVAPGVKLNVSLTRASVTVGGRGVGVNVPITGRSKGRRIRKQTGSSWSIGRFLFRVALVVLAAITILFAIGMYANAADKLPPGAAVYEKFPAESREYLVAAYRQELKVRESALAAGKKTLATAKGNTDRVAATAQRDAAQSALTELKTNNTPPFVGSPFIGELKAGSTFPRWQPGEVGAPGGEPFKVIRVDGDSAALVERMNGKQLLSVEGISTADWSDDEIKSLPGAWWINGTKKLQTRTGGQVVVPVMVPFDWDSYQASKKAD